MRGHPERLGLCGAYNWLDAKAAYEIDETGPSQPVKKGACLDPVKGQWAGVDEYVHQGSHKTVPSVCAYSIMDRPMTSCGCFEVICAIVPECNGIMAVNREYTGDTPAGMTFSTLAGSVGGGQQTPGFMGCGKVFLTSRKFLFAEGGHKRLIWMTKNLKKALGEDLEKRFEEQGVPDLMDRIGRDGCHRPEGDQVLPGAGGPPVLRWATSRPLPGTARQPPSRRRPLRRRLKAGPRTRPRRGVPGKRGIRPVRWNPQGRDHGPDQRRAQSRA